jgi:hypothetical protein
VAINGKIKIFHMFVIKYILFLFFVTQITPNKNKKYGCFYKNKKFFHAHINLVCLLLRCYLVDRSHINQ